MTEITLKAGRREWSNLFLITEKFVNDFDLPEKVTDYFDKWFKAEKEKGKKGKTVLNYNYIGKQICIFLPDLKSDPDKLAEKIRRHAAAFADVVNQSSGKEICIYNQTKSQKLSLPAAEGASLASYQFIHHKASAKDEKNSLSNIIVVSSKISEPEISELNIVCDAVKKCRELVNEPVNILNASALAENFKRMGKDAGVKVEIFKKQQIVKLKMGGLLAVNAGSIDEPTFTIMEYKPAGAVNKQPVVLVGKGVVYDTGGLSLKPTPNSMDLMKCDMAGGAGVASAICAIAKAKIKVHVISLIPATDNRPGFNAFAPGDIITMMDGSKVEMLNSDAEGRMILADALHYAKRFKPLMVIDMATLTGAAVAALGTEGMVGMGTLDQKNKQKLIASSFRVHERIAEFPFWDEYGDMLKSEIADQKNMGGSYAGAITAGKFLVRYTDSPYFHLDIAGPAFLTSKESYRGKGGTGVGVRLLFDFMKSL